MAALVACNNLGSDFDKAVDPIQVNIDGSTIVRNSDGTLGVDVAAVCAACGPTGVSADAGDLLTLGADGLPMLSASAIRALADVEIQDAFGNVMYYAFSENN